MTILFGLADRAAEQAYVRGGLISKLQKALKLSADDIDGVYGPGTAKAAKAWQESQGRPQTGALTFEQWTELTGDSAPELFERCLQITAAFEGHGFGLCKGNFDGALLTWGIIGFTLRHCEIQELIFEIDEQDPTLISTAFGDLESDLRTHIALDVRSDEISAWVNSISDEPFDQDLKPEWKDAFEALGRHELVQQLQRARARKRYWEKLAVRDVERFGLASDLGHAMCFDIVVQCGGVSPEEAEDYRARLRAADQTSAQARRVLLADVVAEHTRNTRHIEDVRARKRTLATGRGRVHQADYDVSLWGLADQASILNTQSPGVLASPEVRFAEFVRTLNLAHFTPDELSVLGAAHRRQGHPGYGLNTLPPEELWPNITLAIRLLDRLRSELGKPIRILSAYRSPRYNTAIGGASSSQHMRFSAIDFVVKDASTTPRDWSLRLARYRTERGFGIGIGIYPDKGFVHVDGRSVAANFGTEPLSV